MSYAEYLALNGGMASCGEGLGVMVDSDKWCRNVPAGWIGVSLEDATTEIVQEALEQAKNGRKHWPEKVEWK
ncbi:hypothetical protein LCGC14_1409960 [marine sediment metagenome]|uniref:Uncharacterized protein n=1 Tax=marine sediment metagenome TaxID=412755 RepID=A0A0F9M9Z8_9ZZZZ